MDFYASWYPGDPVYSLYDDDSAMLISVTSVAARWRVTDLPKLPKRLIIDSGGFRFAHTNTVHLPKALFAQQVKMIQGVEDCEITLCALDVPLLRRDLSSNERDALLETTISNAYEFRYLIKKAKLEGKVKTLCVIQGDDISSLVHCAKELRKLNFDRYGIGSLAMLYKPQEIIARVQAVVDVVGKGVHVFGISAERIMQQLAEIGIGSFDSATPPKSAMYNIVFDSRPFRRFVIPTKRLTFSENSRAPITKPLSCDCPACGGKPNPELLSLGKRRYVYQRTLHNYYHLKCAIMGSPPVMPTESV